MFVLDTGIQASHAEFEGRVEHGIDLVSEDFPIKSDPHGHGTQVAGRAFFYTVKCAPINMLRSIDCMC